MSSELSTIYESTVTSRPSSPGQASLGTPSSLSPLAPNSEQTTTHHHPGPEFDLERHVVTPLRHLAITPAGPRTPQPHSAPPPDARALEALEARVLAAFDAAVVRVQEEWAERVAELEEENERLHEYIRMQQHLEQVAKDRFAARLARAEGRCEWELKRWEAKQLDTRSSSSDVEEVRVADGGARVKYEPGRDVEGTREQKKRKVSGSDDAMAMNDS